MVFATCQRMRAKGASWGGLSHIRGKGRQGGARVYRKSYLPYLDSAENDNLEEQGKGKSEEGEK